MLVLQGWAWIVNKGLITWPFLGLSTLIMLGNTALQSVQIHSFTLINFWLSSTPPAQLPIPLRCWEAHTPSHNHNRPEGIRPSLDKASRIKARSKSRCSFCVFVFNLFISLWSGTSRGLRCLHTGQWSLNTTTPTPPTSPRRALSPSSTGCLFWCHKRVVTNAGRNERASDWTRQVRQQPGGVGKLTENLLLQLYCFSILNT